MPSGHEGSTISQVASQLSPVTGRQLTRQASRHPASTAGTQPATEQLPSPRLGVASVQSTGGPQLGTAPQGSAAGPQASSWRTHAKKAGSTQSAQPPTGRQLGQQSSS